MALAVRPERPIRRPLPARASPCPTPKFAVKPLSSKTALALFALIILAWGLNWPIAKLILLAGVPPLWLLAIRSAIATVVLLPVTLAARSLRLPRRGDWPIVLGISLLHMSLFAALMAVGLQYVPVGRSIVLGYTTPLWVVPGAMLFLGERLSLARVTGVLIGIAGIAVLFNPVGFDWSNRQTVLGNGLLLLASLSWAASMLQVRAHKWVSTPFELVFWETLVATVALTAAAAGTETFPVIHWDLRLALLFAYAGIIGVALAYWAMAVVNRGLPAVTTSLGVLATPVVGLFASMMVLGEPFSATLIVAMLLIGAGILLETLNRPKAATVGAPAAPAAR